MLSLRLADIIAYYKPSLEAANRSPKTICGYMEILTRYSNFLEATKLTKSIEQMGRYELENYVRHLQNSTRWSTRADITVDQGKLSPHTIQVHVRAIKAFWSWLLREGYIEKNPLGGFPLPKVPQKLIKTVTPEQFRMLLSRIYRHTASGAKYYCILLMLLDTGMRISELIKMRVSDLEPAQGLIRIVGKGQKERVVPFSGRTRGELLRYIKYYRAQLYSEESPYLFPSSNGENISANSVQQYMRRLANKADLNGTKFSPHILRHTFATQAIANGANVFTVKDILGHKSLAMTMKYTHLSVSDLKTQHNRFSPVDSVMEKIK